MWLWKDKNKIKNFNFINVVCEAYSGFSESTQNHWLIHKVVVHESHNCVMSRRTAHQKIRPPTETRGQAARMQADLIDGDRHANHVP